MPFPHSLLTVGTVLSALSAPALAIPAISLATVTVPQTQNPGESSTAYELGDIYSGSTFLDGFDFFTGPDPDNGFVQYLPRTPATNARLVRDIGSDTYLGVDFTTPLTGRGPGRNSVRIESKKRYQEGLFIVDLKHMPSSEIGIIGGVNMNSNNKMVLHTDTDCKVDGLGQTGVQSLYDCALDSPSGTAGCEVNAQTPNTYGNQFNSVTGGVYAMEWTDKAIKMWFFPRGAIPASITADKPDTADFGTPLANFAGDCDFAKKFTNHKFIFNTNFCGDVAGNAYVQSGCPQYAGLPSMDSCKKFVAENPSAFSQSYWLISSFKTYKAKTVASSSSSSSVASSTSSDYPASITSSEVITTSSTVSSSDVSSSATSTTDSSPSSDISSSASSSESVLSTSSDVSITTSEAVSSSSTDVSSSESSIESASSTDYATTTSDIISSSSSSSAPLSEPTGYITTPDGTCGPKHGYTCVGWTHGDCCSSSGWCGPSPQHCGADCNPLFGHCDDVFTSSSQSQSSDHATETDSIYVTETASSLVSVPTSHPTGHPTPDGTCGGEHGYTCIGYSHGECCSASEWCGSNDVHCGTGCNPLFGNCGVESLPSQSESSAYETASSTTGTSVYKTLSTSALDSVSSLYPTETDTLPSETLDVSTTSSDIASSSTYAADSTTIYSTGISDFSSTTSDVIYPTGNSTNAPSSTSASVNHPLYPTGAPSNATKSGYSASAPVYGNYPAHTHSESSSVGHVVTTSAPTPGFPAQSQAHEYVTKTYTTTYVDVCSTGLTTVSTTFTATYEKPTAAPTPKEYPEGFTTTVKYCPSGCGAHATNVTVTIPCTETPYNAVPSIVKPPSEVEYVPHSTPAGANGAYPTAGAGYENNGLGDNSHPSTGKNGDYPSNESHGNSGQGDDDYPSVGANPSSGAYPSLESPSEAYPSIETSAYPLSEYPTPSASAYQPIEEETTVVYVTATEVLTLSVVPVPASEYYATNSASAASPEDHVSLPVAPSIAYPAYPGSNATVGHGYGSGTGVGAMPSKTYSEEAPYFTGAASSLRVGGAFGGAVVAALALLL